MTLQGLATPCMHRKGMKLTAALEVEGPRKPSFSDLCRQLGGEESISFSKLI